jgi:class I fructose-bisphosphate aldolase
MWAELQNRDEPIIGALRDGCGLRGREPVHAARRARAVPAVRRQHCATRAACSKYGMPLMIEPLVMLPNDVRGGYQVDGDAEKIVPLVRLAAEMGADIIKADPTGDPPTSIA